MCVVVLVREEDIEGEREEAGVVHKEEEAEEEVSVMVSLVKKLGRTCRV